MEIPIGKPIANTQIWIANPYVNSPPIGVAGERYMAGDGIGAGYLDKLALTVEKFIENPLVKENYTTLQNQPPCLLA